MVITLEVGNTQLRKYEEYAFVLDFKSRSKSTTVRGRTGSIVIAIGEERLTLLEILGNENTIFEVGERVYIGKEGRSKVQSVLGKITYEKISVSAFIDYLNNAQPLTPRVHSLELIPGIGKTYLSVLIQERERKPFESYDDIVRRTHLKEPIIHLTKRILEEISGETRMNIFVKR